MKNPWNRGPEMHNSMEFDLWAGEYDASVGSCEAADAYPFAGYREVLHYIYRAVHAKDSANVLDIGFGTGTLTAWLYREGYRISGVDFSPVMTEIARGKMPAADLYCHDFSKGLPEELADSRFDFICSTYAMHHLSDAEKTDFIGELSDHLCDGGKILIGDVAFGTRAQLDACKARYAGIWDEDEVYFVYNELKRDLHAGKSEFIPISHCAGIAVISK